LLVGASVTIEVTHEQVQAALDAIPMENGSETQSLHEEHLLAKFMLMRWDQLYELAHHLVQQSGITRRDARMIVNVSAMKAALNAMTDGRLKEYRPYQEYLKDRTRVLQDFEKEVV
jgi:hypothetical protein